MPEDGPYKHHFEIQDLGPSNKRILNYSYPKFKADDTPCVEGFRILGTRDWIADGGVHTVRVNNTGLHIGHPYEPTPHDATLKLIGIARIGDASPRTIDVTTPSPTFSSAYRDTDERKVIIPGYWPGVDVEIFANNDQWRIRLKVEDARRKWIISNYKFVGSKFALLYEVEHSALNHSIVDDAGNPVSLISGTDGKRFYFNSGVSRILSLRRPRIRRFEDDLSSYTRFGKFGNVFIRRYSGKTYLAELLNWDDIEIMADGTLYINLTATYQQGVDAYAGGEDTWLEDGQEAPYGSNDTMCFGFPGYRAHVLTRFNIPVLGTITSVKIKLFLDNGAHDPATNPWVKVGRCLRAWVEEFAGWPYYDDEVEWNTHGCLGDGTDYDSDYWWEEDPYTVLTVEDNEYEITVDPGGIAIVDANWQGGSNNGVVWHTGEDADGWQQYWKTSEHADTTKRPLLTLEYTPSAGGYTIDRHKRHRKDFADSSFRYDLVP